MQPIKTDTAHLEWDQKWQTPEGRSAWLTPEQDVAEFIPVVKAAGAVQTLDLGCGVGRHSLLLAREGLKVSALDGSDAGIKFLDDRAREEGLTIETVISEMTSLPYPSGYFDYVLAWNVIYHGDLAVVTRVISEITRVLKAGGLFQGTMLSKRNAEVKVGRLIAFNTYLNDDLEDKSHPHFYCDAGELTGLFTGYELWTLSDREHTREGSHHWHMMAQKL
jgi:tellurite methyltransferase